LIIQVSQLMLLVRQQKRIAVYPCCSACPTVRWHRQWMAA